MFHETDNPYTFRSNSEAESVKDESDNSVAAVQDIFCQLFQVKVCRIFNKYVRWFLGAY